MLKNTVLNKETCFLLDLEQFSDHMRNVYNLYTIGSYHPDLYPSINLINSFISTIVSIKTYYRYGHYPGCALKF